MNEPGIVAGWRSRITGHGEVLATELHANSYNWRRHPLNQRLALAGVLDDIGWVQDVVVNARTGRLVDGHLRVELAAERGETVPVVYVDLGEEEERLILATLDPIGAMAETDTVALSGILNDIETENDTIAALLEAIAQDQRAGEVLAPPSAWETTPASPSPGWRTVRVHFAGPQALEAFAALVGQPIGDKDRAIWYPATP